VIAADQVAAVMKVAHEAGASVHLDGARLFNAQAATGVSAREWADCADTLTFCFSKGLGAPVGSMVCSSADLIKDARRFRKRMGGGMRQVGVLAAAARVAIETGPARLDEDHANARRLAEGLADLDASCVSLETVETNMVYVDLTRFDKEGAEVVDALRERGIVTIGGGGVMRLVTHRDVASVDIDNALEALRDVLAS
jgi:threonine aldolase